MCIATIRKGLILLCVLGSTVVNGQNAPASPPVGYTWQWSDVVPGVAQLHQERFVKAAVFYGGAAWIYANAANYYYRFTQYGYNRDLTAFRQTLAWGAAWHGLALLDGWYYGRRYKPVKRTLFSDKPLKSPWGAALRSLFFPGWGQWYNDAPYKSAFYFTLTATIAYTVYHNDRLYRQTGAYSYKDQRTRYYWYLGLDYLLMVLDAQVDAWLYKFDEVTRWSLGPHPQNGALMFRMEVTF